MDKKDLNKKISLAEQSIKSELKKILLSLAVALALAKTLPAKKSKL